MMFSIIMPAHEWHEYVPLSISSVIKQHFKDWELIICVPTRQSPEFKKQIASSPYAHDPRIVLTECGDMKTYGARRKAIVHAKGRYVLFLDSDDTLAAPSVLDWIAEVIDKNHPDVIQGSSVKKSLTREHQSINNAVTERDNNTESPLKNTLAMFRHGYVVGTYATLHNTCIKNSIIHPSQLQGNPNMRRGEDKLMKLELIADARKVTVVKWAIIQKRNYMASMSRKPLVDFNDIMLYADLTRRFTQLTKSWDIGSCSAINLVAPPLSQVVADILRRSNDQNELQKTIDLLHAELRMFRYRDILSAKISLSRKLMLATVRNQVFVRLVQNVNKVQRNWLIY